MLTSMIFTTVTPLFVFSVVTSSCHDGTRGAVLGLVRDGLRDRRVGVAGQGGAVAAVQVDVLVAVDIPDLRAAAAAEPDRLRHGDLPAGGDAAGEVLLGLLGQALGLG